MVDVQQETKKNNRENARRRHFRDVNDAAFVKNSLSPFLCISPHFTNLKKKHMLLFWNG